MNKVDILENYLCLNNIDLFFLTETWLTLKVNDATVCPSYYNIFRNDRKSRVGSVAVLYRNTLNILRIKKDIMA